MARQTKSIQSKQTSAKYALVADGETEQWYVDQFKSYYGLNIKTTPELPNSKTIKEQYSEIPKLFGKYDKVLWIIDLDVILKNNREPKNHGKSLAEFKTLYKNAVSRWRNNLTIIVNNPCLEYWYCMHSNPNLRTYFESYDKMLPALRSYKVDKQIFEHYTKRKEDYTSGIGLFKKLLPDLKAMYNAKKSKFQPFDIEKCETEGCSEMWKLFEFFNIDPTK